MTIDELETMATHLGITITTHNGPPKGRYQPGVISLSRNMGNLNLRCTLAHELGHAVHADDPHATGWLKARQECRADEYAARLLIDTTEYQLAEHLHGPHPGAIAAELGVTVHLVQVWRRLHPERNPT